VSRSKNTLHNLGWIDPVGKLQGLKTAVRIIMDGKDNYRVRMDKATFAFAGYRATEFPEKIRETAERVLGVRSAVREQYVNDVLFHFERLTIRERRALIEDIIILYEALLFDLGKMDMDFVYPENRALTKRRIPKKSGKPAAARSGRDRSGITFFEAARGWPATTARNFVNVWGFFVIAAAEETHEPAL
jgi:hypothetical protein